MPFFKRKQTYTVYVSPLGNHSIALSKVSAKGRLVDTFFGALEVIDDKVFRHALCGAGPQKLWEIPLGVPKHDEDGELKNSLGLALYRLWGKAVDIYLEAESADRVLELPITEEHARLLEPDSSSWEWYDEMKQEEEEESRSDRLF